MHCSRTIPADIQCGHLRRSTLLSLVLALSSLVIAEPEPEPIAARDGDKCPGGSPQCSQTTYQVRNVVPLLSSLISLLPICNPTHKMHRNRLRHSSVWSKFEWEPGYSWRRTIYLGKTRCSTIAAVMRRAQDVICISACGQTPLSVSSWVGAQVWLFLSWI